MATPSRLLTVRTREISRGEPRRDAHLLDCLPADTPLSWVHDDDGLIGWGVAARLDTCGPHRFSTADRWWHNTCTQFDVHDDVHLPGTGPVAFASMAFDDEPGHSVVVVPRLVIGQRDGRRWITTIGDASVPEQLPEPPQAPGLVRYSDGELPATGYREAVAEAVRHMRALGGIEKVVLAHDLIATTSQPLDPRFLLHNLRRRYPNCWAFAVDGLVGATPEMLLELYGNQVRSRVLAGTSWPRDGLDGDQLGEALFASEKNRNEHAYAVDSLATTLSPFCDQLDVPAEPSILRLPNVVHLASDVAGTLRASDGKPSLLRIAEALHPTAAVGGTPTHDAVQLIKKLETMNRGRYAGPVGWMDGAGNGEFGIALRCAEIQPSTSDTGQARLFAGCGIVADSEPDLEVAEAEAKMLPMREALEASPD